MGSISISLMCLVFLIGFQDYGWTAKASSSPLRELRTIRTDLVRGDLPKRTDATIKVLIEVAVASLRMRGLYAQADKIEADYNDQFYGFLEFHAAGRGFIDIGDHVPLSEWLAVVTETLNLLLGERVMKLTHLNDIRVINYAIPVVLAPCNPDWNNKVEYRKHFVPLSGVISFWGIWTACKIAGGWAIPMTCGAIGSLVENVMVYVFAGPISDAVFSLAKCD